MVNTLKALIRDEDGQGLVEYGLIVALVSVALIAGLQAMQGQLDGVFSRITTALTGAGGGAATPPAGGGL